MSNYYNILETAAKKKTEQAAKNTRQKNTHIATQSRCALNNVKNDALTGVFIDCRILCGVRRWD